MTETLHVHHWHKQKIYCNKEAEPIDLPFIECCCRCNQEREIPPDFIPYNIPSQQLIQAEKAWKVSGNPKSILDKARKLEQKREFEGADQTLKAYHARKAKKKLEICKTCPHTKTDHINGLACQFQLCSCRKYKPET